MKVEIPDFLLEMSQRMNTDDNRCTSHPFWQVRCKEYIPAPEGYNDHHWELIDSEEGCNMDDVIIEDDESYKLWCSSECKAEQEAEDKHRIDAHKAFKEKVMQARPDLTFSHFTADRENWAVQSNTPKAKFTFPSAKHGGDVQMNHIDDDPEIRWTVAMDDLEAWKRYEESRKGN